MIAVNIETWRLIDGLDDYEISSHGFVRNNKTNKIRVNRTNTPGYLYVQIRNKNYMIHQLVASRFCENPHNYPCVDHIDRNKLNNNFTNLRYATFSMNSRNMSMYCTNTSGIKGVEHKINHKRVNDSCWRASIVDNNKKRIEKSFSNRKYPNARELAIEWRKQKEIEYGYL